MICRAFIRASMENGKIDIKAKLLTFIFILDWIWKGHKWVRRTNIISQVILNMVYGNPVWKLGHFYLELDRSKICILFWTQNIKIPYEMGTSILHTKPSLYDCRSVKRSQIFKQNQIILISLRLIVFLLIWAHLAVGAREWVWMLVGLGMSLHTCMCMHMYACAFIKKYIFRNCKWLQPWKYPHLSCLTCVYVCVHMHEHVYAYMHVQMWMCVGVSQPIHPHGVSNHKIQLFEDLWFVETPPAMGGLMGGVMLKY